MSEETNTNANSDVPVPNAESGVTGSETAATAATQPPPLPLPATLPPADASAFKATSPHHLAAGAAVTDQAAELEEATQAPRDGRTPPSLPELVAGFNELPEGTKKAFLEHFTPKPVEIVTGTPAPARGFFTEDELRQNEIDARYKEHNAPDQKAGYCE